jgi:hypothetical protein
LLKYGQRRNIRISEHGTLNLEPFSYGHFREGGMNKFAAPDMDMMWWGMLFTTTGGIVAGYRNC